MTRHNGDVIFLAPNLPDIKVKLTRLLQHAEEEFSCRYPGVRIRIGLGVSESNQPDIKKCYAQACQALDIGSICAMDEPIISYENLGLMSLLLSVQDFSVLKNYYYENFWLVDGI